LRLDVGRLLVTTTLANLLRAVCEDPADDLLRLVLADSLDDQGEDFRASFIREQIRTGEVRDDWNVGAALIVTTGVADSLGLLGVGAATVRRGFVHTVTLPLSAWMKHGPAVVLAAPVEAVVLADKEPDHREGGTGDRAGYWWEPGFAYDGAHQVPFPLAEAGGWKASFIGGLMVYRFPSREVALSALSTAAVSWARQRAGLPPLPREES
jgi:uncharacterized protein (TIGR02996 family)